MQNQTIFAYKKKKIFVRTHFMSFRIKERNNSGSYVHLLRLKRIYVVKMISSVMYKHDHPIRYTILHCTGYVKYFSTLSDCVFFKANM